MADATPAFVAPTDARDGAATRLESDIPARLACLPWGRFHTLVIAALGITWILDGLEASLVANMPRTTSWFPLADFPHAGSPSTRRS